MNKSVPGPGQESIFLIGFMGAGKSTVGVSLAQALGLPFIDLDQHLVLRLGMSIADFFDARGEAAFRRQEELALRELALPAVVALGGGAFNAAATREFIRSQGKSVFLNWPFPILFERINGDVSRPLARDPEQLAQRFRERLPVYLGADLVWHSEPPHQASVGDIVAWVVERLG